MPTAKITSKGQITIPKELREAFDLKPGDSVHFEVQEDGDIVMEPKRGDISELRGCIETEVEGVSLDDMKDAIRQRGGEQ